MTIDQFVNRAEEQLHPAVYRGAARRDADPFRLLLTHGNFLTGRYAFAILPWSAGMSGPVVLKTARAAVARYLFSVPYLVQTGLYLVVLGNQEQWRQPAQDASVDLTSFHATIVQAVHFVDLETRQQSFKSTQWGQKSFGKSAAVAAILAQALA
ncbi:MAG: hypothetical protein K2Y37_18545 [Pirellulales bacterium]|nr:hypothetical protein [Pirellulales bacterium]